MNDAAALDTNPTPSDTANLDDIFDHDDDDDDPDSSMDDDDDDENNAILADEQALNKSDAMVTTSKTNEQSKEKTST